MLVEGATQYRWTDSAAHCTLMAVQADATVCLAGVYAASGWQHSQAACIRLLNAVSTTMQGDATDCIAGVCSVDSRNSGSSRVRRSEQVLCAACGQHHNGSVRIIQADQMLLLVAMLTMGQ